MKTMQRTVLGILEDAAKSFGRRCVIEYNWANTGMIYVMWDDGPIGLRFNFQTRYVTLEDDINEVSYWYKSEWKDLSNALHRFAATGKLAGGER